MIEANQLRKIYGNKIAVQDINFSIDAGQVVALYGEAGAGKTTILRMLAGCIPPSGGSVRICGYDTLSNSIEVRKRVGYLPETASCYPDMSVGSYLDFVAHLHQIPNRKERVFQILERFNLLNQANSLIGKLSNFQHRQVGLAQAVLHQPTVLIMDEPTTGLHPQQILELRRLMNSIISEATVIFSTQNWSEAEQFCDRVLMIQNGRITNEHCFNTSTNFLENKQPFQLQIA